MNLKAMSFKRLIATVIALLSVTVIVLSFFSSSFPAGLKIPGVDARPRIQLADAWVQMVQFWL